MTLGLDFQTKFDKTPTEFRQPLANWFSLDDHLQLKVRDDLLSAMLQPTVMWTITVTIAMFTLSRYRKFGSPEQIREISGALAGSWIGDIVIKGLKSATPSYYVASQLEENLFEGFMAWVFLNFFSNEELLVKIGFSSDTVNEPSEFQLQLFQTANFSVLLLKVLPIFLRSYYANEFDKLFPLNVKQFEFKPSTVEVLTPEQVARLAMERQHLMDSAQEL